MKAKKSTSPLALIRSVATYSRADGHINIVVAWQNDVPGFPARMAIAQRIETLINAAVKKASGEGK